MDVAYVSAMAALVRSVVGGLTSSGTSWLSQRARARAGQMAHEMELREDLFRDFIIFQGVRRCSPEQRAADSGTRVSPRHEPAAREIYDRGEQHR